MGVLNRTPDPRIQIKAYSEAGAKSFETTISAAGVLTEKEMIDLGMELHELVLFRIRALAAAKGKEAPEFQTVEAKRWG